MTGMENTTPQLLSLPALATALKLPDGWIKAEADAGRIPHLRIGNRYRFNLDAVIRALAERAAERKEVSDA
jgi:excisionase family DNA binding protein